ncbi:TadE/TadG family type IV pilus assembly protein [Sphingomonas sp. RS2018]
MIRALHSRLRRDRRGATIIEFALVAPVMFLMLLGAFEVSHRLYTKAVLEGVVQKTARDSSLEIGASASAQVLLDEKVRKQLRAMYNGADIKISRRYYRTFTDAANARAEDYTDTNRNNTCDAGEPFEDDNRNGVWDADGGNGGQGGAKDATLYTVKVSYPSLFPVTRLVGGTNLDTVEATTVLKNQPYGDQGAYGAMTIGNCP